MERLRIINQWGIKVPEDLALVSLMKVGLLIFYAALTFVRQSIEDIEKGALELVIDRIINRGKNTPLL